MILKWPREFLYGLLAGIAIVFLAILVLPKTSSFFEHTAWPLAAVTVAWLLREQLAAVLDRVESFEGKGYTVKLRRTIERMSAARLDSPEPAVSGGSSDVGMDSKRLHLKRLAAASPPAAIIESWLLVEEAAHSLAARVGDQAIFDKRSPHAIESWLRSTDFLSQQAQSVVTELRILRNLAAHARPAQRKEIQYDDAVRAIEVAVGIVDVLENAGLER